jgi:hypothetical protein
MTGKRKHGGTATVSLHVRDVAQLFNSFDPSPFWDRDLDPDAATFIENEFSDRRSADHWHLNVHAQNGGASREDLQAAIENYYTRLAASARRDLAEHRQMGQIALLGGIAIFLACMGTRELLLRSLGDLPRIVDEGLIILAWVAMWRPVEALTYEWVPYLRKRRLFERLAGIRVAVRSAPAPTPGGRSGE